MKKEIIDMIKKQWLVLWIIIVSMPLLAMSASAFYESKVSTMNRVVVASSSQGMMFSSNYLEEGGDNAYTAKYCMELNEADKATGTYDAEVYIWNYNPANISRWYSTTINYTLEVALTNTKGQILNTSDLDDQTVILCDANGNELTTLSAGKLSDTIGNLHLVSNPNRTSQDNYTLKYSGNWDLDNDTEICVQMVAKPNHGNDNSQFKDLKDIGQVIGLKRSTSSESKGWTAYLKEQRSGETLSKCDGFNLVLNGSGQATITITWNMEYLDFNRNFYLKDTYLYNYSEVEHRTYTTGEGDDQITWGEMIIQANTASSTTNHRNRYDIQLYKTGKEAPANWDFFADQNATQEQKDAAWVKVSVNMT